MAAIDALPMRQTRRINLVGDNGNIKTFVRTVLGAAVCQFLVMGAEFIMHLMKTPFYTIEWETFINIVDNLLICVYALLIILQCYVIIGSPTRPPPAFIYKRYLRSWFCADCVLVFPYHLLFGLDYKFGFYSFFLARNICASVVFFCRSYRWLGRWGQTDAWSSVAPTTNLGTPGTWDEPPTTELPPVMPQVVMPTAEAEMVQATAVFVPQATADSVAYAAAPQTKAAPTLTEQILELKELFDQGILDRTEFAAAKAKLLA